MTEQEWLDCTDPQKMGWFLQGKASERKLRLFALACSCRFLHLLCDERGRQAVAIAERFVEGEVTHQERARVAEAAWQAANDAKSDRKTGAVIAAAVAAARMADSDSPLFAQRFASSGVLGQQYAWHAVWDSVFFIDKNDQCSLWRDIIGNPFRPVALDPSWRTWHGGLLVSMARRMYDTRDFSDMPVLADALEEAGCADSDILNHCRQPGEHVRGCWVVDRLMGKS